MVEPCGGASRGAVGQTITSTSRSKPSIRLRAWSALFENLTIALPGNRRGPAKTISHMGTGLLGPRPVEQTACNRAAVCLAQFRQRTCSFSQDASVEFAYLESVCAQGGSGLVHGRRDFLANAEHPIVSVGSDAQCLQVDIKGGADRHGHHRWILEIRAADDRQRQGEVLDLTGHGSKLGEPIQGA